MRRSALYPGTLVHTRDDAHARRTFRYPVYMAAIDLDELPALDRDLRLFSLDRHNLFALHAADYEAGRAGLAEALHALLVANALPVPATTRLVTNLRVAGYGFNPVSFFLNYDAGGALTTVIAEVNNTYGGRFRYVLGPAQRLPEVGPRIGFAHPRELFVSPFLHGPCTYEFWFDAPLDATRLAITMHVTTADGRQVFHAALAGRRRPLTDRSLLGVAVRYPLMTAQVIGLIHLEAIKLRLLGAPYGRPDAGHRPLAADPRR